MFADLLKKVEAHRIFTQAAALAFYATLSLGPLLMIFFLLLSLAQINIQNEFVFEVQRLLGSTTSEIVQNMLVSFDNTEIRLHSVAGFIALGALLLSASGVFVQLRESLDLIIADEKDEVSTKYSATPTGAKSFFLNRLFSIGMALTFVFLSTLSLLLSSILSRIVKLGNGTSLYLLLNSFISICIFSLLFYFMYYFIPKSHAQQKSCWWGAITTAVFFVIGKEIIGQLAASTLMVSSYGSAGALVVLMAWFYYASMILLMGAEIVRIYEKKL